MSAPAPKPFSLQAPERIAMEYGGNKQKIAQAVQSGLVDPTSGLLAGMFIDRMRAAQVQEQAPNQTVAQQVLGPQGPQGGPPPPGGPPPQGAPQGGPPPGGPPPPPPPQGGPPPQGPVGMAEGGLTSLPVPDYMFDEQTFAGGGIVAFARGDQVDARAERLKALMSVVRNPNASSEDRMAARAEINKMEGMGPGRTPGPGLADALADLDAATGAPVGGTRLDPAEFNRNPSPSNLFGNAEAAQRGPQMPNLSGFGDAIMAANLRETDAARGTDASGGMSLRSPELAAIDARSRARNEAAGQVPFRGFADALKSPELAAIDARSRAKNEAAGQVPFRGAGKYFLPIPERLAFEARERSKAAESPATNRGVGNAPPPPSASGYKPNLGSVNMGGYDPNRSSPEAQLNALLGKPAPDAGVGALMASQSARADTARIPGAGRRTGAGAATTRPSASTTAAAAAAPEMSDEELVAKRNKDFAEANKLPEYKGTSAEDKAARKKEDLYSALMQAGFSMMAGTSQNALTNIGEGLKAAMPGMQASLKERRADEKEDLKQQYAYQLAQAGVKGKAYEFSMTQFDKLKDNRFREKTLAETIRHNQEVEKLQGQQVAQSGSTGTERLVRLMAAGMPGGATPENLAKAAEIGVKGYSGAGTGAEIYNKAGDNVDAAIGKNLVLSQRLRKLAQQDKKNAKDGKPSTLYDTEYERLKKAEYNRLTSASLSPLGGQTPELPPGFNRD